MKLAVCGGRGEHMHPARIDALVDILATADVTEVVTGGCAGIDLEAEDLARRSMFPTTTFRPAWDVYGKAAGPLRNAEIAAYADALVAFPGGRGTEDMVEKMEKLGKPVWRLE